MKPVNAMKVIRIGVWGFALAGVLLAYAALGVVTGPETWAEWEAPPGEPDRITVFHYETTRHEIGWGLVVIAVGFLFMAQLVYRATKVLRPIVEARSFGEESR